MKMSGTRTAIINEALARRLLPGVDPVGRRIWIEQTAYDVIGVVGDYSNNVLRAEKRNRRCSCRWPGRRDRHGCTCWSG